VSPDLPARAPVAAPRPTLVGRGLLAAVVAGALTGCTIVISGPPTPSAPVTTPATTPTVSIPPTTPPTSAQPSTPTPSEPTPSESEPAAVTASGSIALYQNVSTHLDGTCQRVDDAATFTLRDSEPEFFEKADVTVALETGDRTVALVTADFGEDSEGVAWKLTYDRSAGVKGASATLAVKAGTWKVSGKALVFEGASAKGRLTPFSVSVTCAAGDW
jgi:hypothetical protein